MPAFQNFTIVVNWKAKGFGCAKVCSYCNWRDSPLLPHGGQSPEAITAFISQCRKSFITISGGADPLYRFEEYGDQLRTMVGIVKSAGFKVRIITREVQHVAVLKRLVDCVSVSLDAEVLETVEGRRHEWAGIEVEYSLVLPPLPTADIVQLKPQYVALHRRLGARLVLRENLNSIYPLDFLRLSFGHNGIVFVPKALCLSSRYLTTIDCTGHQVVQDNEALAGYLMNDPDILLFGGFVKHLVNPVVHMEYADIDVVATDARVMQVLARDFGFTFKDMSPADTGYPRYFIGRSTRAGKTIQLVLVKGMSDALRFVMSAQYDADRLAYSAGRFHFDAEVGEENTLRAINTKQVSHVNGPRDTNLFNINRPLIEQRHKAKLLRKGFIINEDKEARCQQPEQPST